MGVISTEKVDSVKIAPQLECSLYVDTDSGLLARGDGYVELPGQPWVSLASDGDGDGDEMLAYVRKAHGTSGLQTLSRLINPIATHHSSHKSIIPLHVQAAVGRYPLGVTIVPNEHPDLHLAQINPSTHSHEHNARLLIKPMPVYMLSQAFWDWLQRADRAVYASAVGFMRSYCSLIRHEADFRLASNPTLGLIPSSTSCSKPVTFDAFIQFISQFADLDDNIVAPRYRYGVLQLYNTRRVSDLFRGEQPQQDTPLFVQFVRAVQVSLFLGWIVAQFFLYRGASVTSGQKLARFFTYFGIMLLCFVLCSLPKSIYRSRVARRAFLQDGGKRSEGEPCGPTYV
ncbi:hypothetical protein BJ170DRAFT_107844 [Xylariales sp. AK1849]|nr:hypothetical protein BJ170DRAFT_107844 [Xylariales sp. AK1849]